MNYELNKELSLIVGLWSVRITVEFPSTSLVCAWSTELKGLGADFVFGFVQSMDGERDPRNLLLAFQIAKNIIHRGYDLGELTSLFLSLSEPFLLLSFWSDATF